MANKVGRPTLYNEELQAKADEYLTNWHERDAVPSRVGLCCYLGISKRVSHDWGAIHEPFLHTLEAIEALQEYTAINKGITGEFNSTITKLVLVNHGYSDKKEAESTTAEDIAKALAKLAEGLPN
jgi:hypothetical protein